MSLLSESYEACTILDKTTRADGYGGVVTDWTDGAEIQASVVLDDSIEAVKAQAAGAKNLYTVTTSRTVVLMFHDVFRRESDGKTFRVTSDGTDKKTPTSAGLDMRQVRAEEWSVTDG